MKRILSRYGIIAFFLVVAIIGLLLTGCSTPRDDSPSGNPDKWYTITDPSNGLRFRCHEVLSTTHNQYEVRGEWCYGPIEVADDGTITILP